MIRAYADTRSASLTAEPEAEPIIDLPAEPGAPSQEGLQAPRYGTRGSAQGRKGCWAVNRAGFPCAAPKRGDSDYCNAHSGRGVAENPSGFSEAAVRKSAEVRRRRAELRLVLGSTRLDTPKGVLKAAVLLNAERLAGRAVSAALDPGNPDLQAARLALDLIEAADPDRPTTVSLTGDLDAEAIGSMGFRELLSFAQQHGIDPSPTLSTASIEAETA